MTRIKEYMELLTSELEEFRGDVNRLKTINDQIKDAKVAIDLSEIKALLEEYNNQLKRQSELQERQYRRFEVLFKKAGVYPKWAIITFILAILISVVSLVYAYKTKTTLEKFKDANHIEKVIPNK
ncbi:DUF6730 family protein [Maribacter arcticus]|uniref:DUF6730 family protein n=1 Tax=Maribacter arcticus TaxID=561365 RepID=UPI0030DC073D|tara:strand:- start:337 stop:711 length:375 start_codon:yes stop_codon:yes gene_type:complete